MNKSSESIRELSGLEEHNVVGRGLFVLLINSSIHWLQLIMIISAGQEVLKEPEQTVPAWSGLVERVVSNHEFVL